MVCSFRLGIVSEVQSVGAALLIWAWCGISSGTIMKRLHLPASVLRSVYPRRLETFFDVDCFNCSGPHFFFPQCNVQNSFMRRGLGRIGL